MAIEIHLGDLVQASDVEKFGLREIYPTDVQNVYRARLLEGLRSPEASFGLTYGIRLSFLQGEYPSGVGGRSEQEGRKMDHAVEKRCCRQVLGGLVVGHDW